MEQELKKKCKICNEIKSLNDFENAKRYADKKDTRCRDCRKQEHILRKKLRKEATNLGLLYDGVICPICNTKTVLSQKESYTRQAVVDHNHNTGKIRGVICSLCNSGLGKLGDTLKNLENAVKYLSKPSVSIS